MPTKSHKNLNNNLQLKSSGLFKVVMNMVKK